MTLDVDTLHYRPSGNSFSLGPVTLRAQRGQFWAVLGSNGAGKSTLFDVLSGQSVAESGHLQRDGECSLVPQHAEIPGRFTVQGVLNYLAVLHRVDRDQRPARIQNALDLTGLTDLATQKVGKLSGGQRRRVVIAQALLSEPEILLMDEPSAGLDLDQRDTLRSALKRLRQDRVILVSSHIIEDLAGLASHVLHLRDGRALFTGPVEDYLLGPEAAPPSVADASSPTAWTAAYYAWNAGRPSSLDAEGDRG